MSSSTQNQGGSATPSRRKVVQAAFDDAFRALCAERGPYIALNRATQLAHLIHQENDKAALVKEPAPSTIRAHDNPQTPTRPSSAALAPSQQQPTSSGKKGVKGANLLQALTAFGLTPPNKRKVEAKDSQPEGKRQGKRPRKEGQTGDSFFDRGSIGGLD